jgi:hypothetical protein
MFYSRILLLPLLIGGFSLLTACHSFLGIGTSQGANEPEYQEGTIQDVQYNVRVGKNMGAGQLPSGPIGASHAPNATANVIGSVGGVAVSRKSLTGTDSSATLYIVKLDSGQLRSVIEQPDEPALCVGDRVYFEEGSSNPLLTLDEAYYDEGHHVRSSCLTADDEDSTQ